MTDMSELGEVLLAVVRERNAVIERTVSLAVKGGEHGVAVIEHTPTFDINAAETYRMSSVIIARVDPRVPYGHLFNFPSKQAYDNWVENGCPK